MSFFSITTDRDVEPNKANYDVDKIDQVKYQLRVANAYHNESKDMDALDVI